jgi:host factor-I protein
MWAARQPKPAAAGWRGNFHGGRSRAEPSGHVSQPRSKEQDPLTIFLVNGVKLQGVVTWFDNFCVLLRRDGHSQLVYKHAISTIMPGSPVQLFDQTDDVAEKA